MRLTPAQLAQHYKLLVVGGGAGGLGTASKFCRILPQGSVAIVEPSEKHYYQPGFTFIGANVLTLADNVKQESDLIPKKAKWYRSAASKIQPDKNSVLLNDGSEITYDYLVLATGIQPRYDLIKGAKEALDAEGSGVGGIYLPHYAEKFQRELKAFQFGKALFTFPSGPIKCAGAPQKIMYLSEETFRNRGIREQAEVHYFTSLPRIFGVEKYANALMKIVEKRQIQLHTRHVLKELDGKSKIAHFDKFDGDNKPTGETVSVKYDLLHIAPPCRPAPVISECSALTDASGFVDVDPVTMQSKRFPNVFAVGDNANSPNAKTAAAVSGQVGAIGVNLKAVMDGKPLTGVYDGYASCPLLVGDHKVILAEFNHDGPLETLPINQAKPLTLSYMMKRYIMQPLYWYGLLRGYWNGPRVVRKLLHLGMSK